MPTPHSSLPPAPSLWWRTVLPFLFMLGVLLLAVFAGDALLHRLGLAWIGRWLGIPGVLLIVLSLVYSLRKRKLIRSGDPRSLLAWHEGLAWVGALMVMVHAGVHFEAVLPWLATIAMVVNIVSGLVGKFLLDRSRRHLAEARAHYAGQGLNADEQARALFLDAVTTSMMARWRAVHFPISFAFAVLALGHVVSVLLFWSWS